MYTLSNVGNPGQYLHRQPTPPCLLMSALKKKKTNPHQVCWQEKESAAIRKCQTLYKMALKQMKLGGQDMAEKPSCLLGVVVLVFLNSLPGI